jgi:hypothetical protein
MVVDLLRCLSRRDVVGQRGKAKNGQEAESFETFETLFCPSFARRCCFFAKEKFRRVKKKENQTDLLIDRDEAYRTMSKRRFRTTWRPNHQSLWVLKKGEATLDKG